MNFTYFNWADDFANSHTLNLIDCTDLKKSQAKGNSDVYLRAN